jgi:hypothetical protein
VTTDDNVVMYISKSERGMEFEHFHLKEEMINV